MHHHIRLHLQGAVVKNPSPFSVLPHLARVAISGTHWEPKTLGAVHFFIDGGGGGGGGFTFDGGGGLTFLPSLMPLVTGPGGGGLGLFLPIFSLPCLLHELNPFHILDIYDNGANAG